jgi:CheY-like chemotaxis protein
LADVLCADGRYAAAIRLEELWNAHFGGSGVSLLCAYDMSRFDEDSGGSCLRTICRAHTLVIPTEVYPEGLDERARFEHVALVQQRARQRSRQSIDPAGARVPVTAEVICVIEDDPSVRRSLSRLLGSVGLRVKTYPSAEAFLSGINEMSVGCIIADVQLTGMSGLELQARLQGMGWPMILTSGAASPQVEAEALRRGARAFLRKPFQALELLEAIRLAVS